MSKGKITIRTITKDGDGVTAQEKAAAGALVIEATTLREKLSFVTFAYLHFRRAAADIVLARMNLDKAPDDFSAADTDDVYKLAVASIFKTRAMADAALARLVALKTLVDPRCFTIEMELPSGIPFHSTIEEKVIYDELSIPDGVGQPPVPASD